jgi:hypothetical protein
MHSPHDVSSATIARQRAFGNYPGLFRGRGDCGRHQPITPNTTIEC